LVLVDDAVAFRFSEGIAEQRIVEVHADPAKRSVRVRRIDG